MQHGNPSVAGARPRFAWRALTSVLIAASFVILVFSGIVLFVSPPGRIANWTDWSILHLTKKDWTAVHIWFSTLFLVVTLVHLFFNWRPLVGYFKDRLTRRVGFRWEWLVALAICGGVYAGTRTGVPPFSTLLAFNERVKESWDQPRARAPIPHAELLTLAELAQKAGVDMATVSNRLQARGITGVAPEVVVEALAARNRRSAQQLYELILAEPARSEAGHGRGKGAGGSGGGGAGGGSGWKTLSQFCVDEGLSVSNVLVRLKSRGIEATAGQTMREIAVNHGYDRPFELIELIRSTKP